MTISGQLFAINHQKVDSDTARAYQAYLLTFIWPSYASNERINYQNINDSNTLPRYSIKQNDSSNLKTADIEPLFIPFTSFKNRIAAHVSILVNQTWTLIFNHVGDAINQTFHSQPNSAGYPNFTGSINIRLGHFLESKIQYKQYLFTPIPNATATNQNTESSEQNLIPTQVLNLIQENKTASRKLNYIDHPIIGTLLYFEPMKLKVALQQRNLDKLKARSSDNSTILINNSTQSLNE